MAGSSVWGRVAAAVVAVVALGSFVPSSHSEAAAEKVTTVSYDGPPVPIPDGPASGDSQDQVPVFATISVAGLGSILDVDLRFDGTNCSTAAGATTVGLSHTWPSDLRISITSPSLTTIELIDTDGSGRNLCQTTFTDEAASDFGATSSDGTFSGAQSGFWRPNESLSAFDGEDPDGTWTLKVTDTATEDVGTLYAFSLLITTAGSPPTQPLEFSYGTAGAAIPTDHTAVTTTIDVGAVGSIVDLDLRLDGTECSDGVGAVANLQGIYHPNPDSLEIVLTSPSGTIVRLTDAIVGGQQTGRNLCLTTFTDEGPLAFSTAQPHNAPYAGFWRPLDALSAVDGQNASGTWTLSVTDLSGTGGSVNGWSLVMTTDESEPTTTTTTGATTTTTGATTTTRATTTTTRATTTTTGATTTTTGATTTTTAPAGPTTSMTAGPTTVSLDAGGPNLNGGGIPSTGAESTELARWALTLIVLGAAITLCVRRRATAHRGS